MAAAVSQQQMAQASNLIELTHETGNTLGAHDIVGSTFYIALNAMLACTIFFFLERESVPKQWKKSITVAMLVTGVATWNYLYTASCILLVYCFLYTTCIQLVLYN